ncbi:MAG: protease pro-enzyme activation domain-containing protein [Terriglobia bacterium]
MIFRSLIAAILTALFLTAAPDRLSGPINPARTKTLRGFVHPKARPEADLGLADAAMPLADAILILKPAPGLEAFLAGKHNPLTPEQFAERFGASGNDAAKIVQWLEGQGLHVNTVGRGRQWISFSGTAATVGRAFHTEIHRYKPTTGSKPRFANATEPAIPADLENVVAGLHGLNNFGMRPMLRGTPVAVPEYNNSKGVHYIAPDDIATIYDVSPLYAMGIDGTGQKIAIAGETDIDLADIRAFRKKFNLPPNDPTVMLFGDDPGQDTGDILLEADLDLEWSGAVAPKASIIYVNSTSAFSSAIYAIDNMLAPVLSLSFGACEIENSPDFRVIGQQAAAEGITWVSSSGDSGASDCDRTSPTPQATKGLTVTFPASFPEVTAIGGTMFDEGKGTYWSATPGPNLGSALSYIPEAAWNDSLGFNAPVAGGGGASAFYPKPYWQVAPGVPDDGARDTPDVSLNAGVFHDSYLVQSGGSLLAGIGGTSVGTPIFAGMVSLLNQYLVSKNTIPQAGLGNINPSLYRMAQGTSDVFHDVTAGSNIVACAQATPNCVDGLLGYSAGAGYDLATGLGSVDAFHMATEWNIGTLSTTTVTAAPLNANLSDTITLTATVASKGTASPQGTVTFLSSENILGTVNLTPGANATSTAVLSIPEVRIAEGDGTVQALYNGDASTGSSGNTVSVTLIIPSSGSLVVPSVDPNPVYQTGGVYSYSVTLQELAGVPTKLTGFTFDGAPAPLTFFPKTTIPAFGFIQTSLANVTGIVPTAGAHVFGFTGADVTGGKTWSQSVTAIFLPSSAPSIGPSILLSSVPATVLRNPAAPAECQWSQQLTVQEKSGFLTTLSSLTIGTTNFSSQIQQIFGTTRLAPYGVLYGNFCWSSANVSATKTFTLVGVAEIGQAGSGVTATYANAPAAPATFSISRPTILFAGSNSTSIDLNFTGGDSVWTASVLPANFTSRWLTLTPTGGGAGPAQVTVQASTAGLSKGVYRAYITFQAANAFPQAINVPVTLVVGNSSSLSITGISNAASGDPIGAPGAQMRVTGDNLASSLTQTSPAPLNLILAGVSATVNGVSTPLYSVASGEIVFQVPYETPLGMAVFGLNNNGQITYREFPVAISAPGIYPANVQTGPAQSMTIFITGEGDVTPTLTTGASPAAGTSTRFLPHSRLPLSVTVGGMPAKVLFSGIPAGLVGVAQINFTVPAGLAPGIQPVVVTVGPNSSPALVLLLAR